MKTFVRSIGMGEERGFCHPVFDMAIVFALTPSDVERLQFCEGWIVDVIPGFKEELTVLLASPTAFLPPQEQYDLVFILDDPTLQRVMSGEKVELKIPQSPDVRAYVTSYCGEGIKYTERLEIPEPELFREADNEKEF